MAFNVENADFDNIKANIIEYLQNDDTFKDYDYTGSALNTIIDALAYATHYMIVHANININEMFLDTALIRSSVVSKAKELGYIPKQYTSATALVHLSVDTSSGTIPSSLIVPSGTIFSGVDTNGDNYRFLTSEDKNLTDDGFGVFSGDVYIKDGRQVIESWVYKKSLNTKFILSNDQVDVSTIKVDVKPIVGSTTKTDKYNSTNYTTIDANSEVFFVQETPQEKVEVYFGDNTLGKSIENNNQVNITYNVSHGVDANNISNFVLISDIGGIVKEEFAVNTVESASGGDDRETIQSIKHIAPKAYQAQNRCVTKDDYKAIILRDNANIKSINVWGGETEIPPQYGKFFISIRTSDGSDLSPIKKTSILDNLDKFNVLTIIPEIVDPAKVYINVDSIVTYNQNKTTLTKSDLESLVNTTVDTFFEDQVYDFDDKFRHSALTGVIDNTDSSILGNTTTITLKDSYVTQTGNVTRNFNYANEIIPKTLTTNAWVDGIGRTLFISDYLGDGKLYQNINGSYVTSSSVGAVEYVNGVVDIIGFDFGISNETITMTASPKSNDISAKFNTLLIQGNVNIVAENSVQ